MASAMPYARKAACLEEQQRSSLPEAVDFAEINKLLAKAYQGFWKRSRPAT